METGDVAQRDVKVEVKNSRSELVPTKTEIGKDGIVRAFCT